MYLSNLSLCEFEELCNFVLLLLNIRRPTKRMNCL